MRSLLAATAVLAAASAEQVFQRVNISTASGAVCLDGSQPVVYVNKPAGAASSDPPKVILFLQGGGWCFSDTLNTTIEACVARSKTSLGSSLGYGPTFTPSYEGGNGLLWNDTTGNPTFGSGFTYVYARYCDGASFAGDVEDPLPVGGTTLYFRGHRILRAIFEYLESDLGLGEASEAVLAGCSAGGLATYAHCDEFAAFAREAAQRRGRLSSSVKTRCIADAGYFPDFEALPSKEHKLALRYQLVTELQNTTGHTNAACESALGADAWRCFFPEVTAPHLSTPIFALNSGYDSWQLPNDWFSEAPAGSVWYNCSKDIKQCSGVQLEAVQAFHKEYVDVKLAPILDPASPHGAFIDSCYEHCQSGATWVSGAAIRGTRIVDAVDAWYGGSTTKLVMAPYGTSEAGSTCTAGSV